MSEVNEKESETSPKKRSTVAINTRVPMTVHNKIIKWNLTLSAARGRQINLMEAYREFLIEKTKSL